MSDTKNKYSFEQDGNLVLKLADGTSLNFSSDEMQNVIIEELKQVTYNARTSYKEKSFINDVTLDYEGVSLYSIFEYARRWNVKQSKDNKRTGAGFESMFATKAITFKVLEMYAKSPRETFQSLVKRYYIELIKQGEPKQSAQTKALNSAKEALIQKVDFGIIDNEIEPINE